jgi:hypothetical protein
MRLAVAAWCGEGRGATSCIAHIYFATETEISEESFALGKV